MPNDLITMLTGGASGGAASGASASGVTTVSTGNKGGETPTNPLIEVLTQRLTQQAQGITTSSSSNLQSSINEAIAGTQAAGEATAQRLASERQREVAFARDRAGATYTTALEGRTGYASQAAGLRELTDSTEKSIRDLDQRYREAELANDANTASQIAQLRMQKLQFQFEQEQNFYNNLFALANMQEDAINRQVQNEQFWADQDRQRTQFTTQLAESRYQFEKDLGLKLKGIALDEQRLELERDRNKLSWAQYNEQKRQYTEQKNLAYTQALVTQDIKNKIAEGTIDQKYLNTPEYLQLIKEQTGYEGPVEDLSQIINTAYNDVTSNTEFMSQFNQPTPVLQTRTGGVAGALSTTWRMGYAPIFQGIADFYLGKKQ